jgi:carboxylesterase
MSTGEAQHPASTDRAILHEGGDTGVLLIHGLGGTPVEMRFVAQGLARAGFTVYCCQLAGHCGTPDELRRSHRDEWRASVLAAHDLLSRRCSTVLAGGLSMGALLALDLAHTRPADVHGLLLLAPSLRLDGWAMPWTSRHILPHVRPLPFWRSNIYLKEREPYGLKDERIRALVVKTMLSGDSSTAGVFSTPLHSFAHFNAISADVRRKLPDVRTPTLILHPREDDMASLDNALTIQRRLAGPVELVVLDDSYHIITLDRQRNVVVDRAIAFCRSIERRQLDLAGVPTERRQHAE